MRGYLGVEKALVLILEEEEGFLSWWECCSLCFSVCALQEQQPCAVPLFLKPLSMLKERPLELFFFSKKCFLISALKSYSRNPLKPLKRTLELRLGFALNPGKCKVVLSTRCGPVGGESFRVSAGPAAFFWCCCTVLINVFWANEQERTFVPWESVCEGGPVPNCQVLLGTGAEVVGLMCSWLACC